MTSSSHAELTAALRDAGLRVTGPRLAVLSVVMAGKHMTAEQVEVGAQGARRHDLHAGRLRRARRADPRWLPPQDRTGRQPARYETRVDDNHHHLVCRSCGAISDVDCVIGDPPCVTPTDAGGFLVDEAEVTFWGLCPDCQTSPTHQEKESGA